MKSFIEEVGNIIGFQRKDLIEKDIILHNLLLHLLKYKFFRENFLFKGGTCLIKSYFDYYRFSEDIDFTWREQDVFRELSQKGIRKYLADIIDKFGDILEKYDVDFVSDKSDRKYIELAGGNKTVTFKLWYDSEILNYKTFVKVQINFVEKILFPIEEREIKSLIHKRNLHDLKTIFPHEYARYSKNITLLTYDIREILCEKVRAILTRKGIKARDFVDTYMICRDYKVDIEKLESQIIDKTRFILRMYERYRKSFEEKMKLIERDEDLFEWGDEKSLLLMDLNEKDFYRFVEEFKETLKTLVKKI